MQDADRTERGAHAGQQRADAVEPFVAERADAHAVDRIARRAASRTSGSTAPSCFGSMLTRTSGQAPSRSSNSGIGSRPSTFASRTTDHGRSSITPVAVGDAVEDVVVEGEQHAVGGDVHVGLDVAVAEPNCVLERRHRVLGDFARAAAVRERDRSGPVEEGEVARAASPAGRYPGCVSGGVSHLGRSGMPEWPSSGFTAST